VFFELGEVIGAQGEFGLAGALPEPLAERLLAPVYVGGVRHNPRSRLRSE
jgi:hypothetical protein